MKQKIKAIISITYIVCVLNNKVESHKYVDAHMHIFCFTHMKKDNKVVKLSILGLYSYE